MSKPGTSQPSTTRDAAEIARLSAAAMWAEDKASRGLGMKIEKVGPGLAVLSMSVSGEMVNGHGFCHGGYIFTLADSAFAFACNSHSQRHVAQQCHITYVAPGRLGMRLIAEARERQRGERSGIYDVTVRSEAGEVIAEFRGNSRSIPGALVAPA
jgi:acyl-CoA thioesterase